MFVEGNPPTDWSCLFRARRKPRVATASRLRSNETQGKEQSPTLVMPGISLSGISFGAFAAPAGYSEVRWKRSSATGSPPDPPGFQGGEAPPTWSTSSKAGEATAPTQARCPSSPPAAQTGARRPVPIGAQATMRSRSARAGRQARSSCKRRCCRKRAGGPGRGGVLAPDKPSETGQEKTEPSSFSLRQQCRQAIERRDRNEGKSKTPGHLETEGENGAFVIEAIGEKQAAKKRRSRGQSPE